MLLRKKISFFPFKKVIFILFFFSFLFFQTPCFSLITIKDTKGTLLPITINGYSFWEQGSFVIRFMREGESAVPRLDSNNDGCPDFVENVALQLIAAEHIFCDVAGFPSPLGSKFYPDAKKVYVSLTNKKKMGGANGQAFDLTSYFKDLYATDTSKRQPKVGGLSIKISKDINPTRNRTPMHEYFHLIENSMTHIKNRWYYEGMAAWAQNLLYPFPLALNSKFSPNEAVHLLMNSQSYKKYLVSQSYSAAKLLWNPLSKSCPEASIPLPENDFLLDVTYLDGTPIIKDSTLTGVRFMRRVLELLGEYENIPFALYDYKSWGQKNRRRETNNEYIIEAILQAYGEVCPSMYYYRK